MEEFEELIHQFEAAVYGKRFEDAVYYEAEMIRMFKEAIS